VSVSWRVLAGVVVALAACSASAPRDDGLTDVGVYRFMERVEGGESAMTILLEGSITVMPDTVVIDAVPGPCQYMPGGTRMSMTYRCGNFTISYDRFARRDPARYSVRTTTYRHTRVCRRYVIDAQGRQTNSCAQWATETTEVPATRSGRIRLQRVEGSGG
jgi:hypothetical protein